MSTPRPNFTPSRLNVEPYRVTVRALKLDIWRKQMPDVYEGGVKYLEFEYIPTLTYKPVTSGTLHPDGSLTVEPEPWAPRHYRRAVMRGAGVYQAGLWAMLAGRAQPDPAQVAQTEHGAALGVNDALKLSETLKHYSAATRLWPRVASERKLNRATRRKHNIRDIRGKRRSGVSKRAQPYKSMADRILRKHLIEMKNVYRNFGPFWVSTSARLKIARMVKSVEALGARQILSRKYAPLLACMLRASGISLTPAATVAGNGVG